MGLSSAYGLAALRYGFAALIPSLVRGRDTALPLLRSVLPPRRQPSASLGRPHSAFSQKLTRYRPIMTNQDDTNKPNTYVVIMAGGIGSRFWPSSRAAYPKQFLDILGLGKSLLRLTFERFLPLCPAERILVVTHEDYRDLVQAHLPELSPAQILCEPSRRNTAPCIAYAALKLQAKDPESSFIVAPSDHLILKEAEFLGKITKALELAQQGYLLTLGIQPTRPDTGYGYIRYAQTQGQACRVERFTEKPDLATAQGFLAQGNYLWNAGIFIWQTKAIIEALARYAPDVYAPLAAQPQAYWTAEEAEFIGTAYAQTPAISIDYAVMERAEQIYTLPADIGWSDLGTWASLYTHLPQDAQGNAADAQSAAGLLLEETQNCLVRLPKGKRAVIRGLDNYIVVDEQDVLLIYPKDQEQDIKQVQAKMGD